MIFIPTANMCMARRQAIKPQLLALNKAVLYSLEATRPVDRHIICENLFSQLLTVFFGF
jgi:hypothetical protein